MAQARIGEMRACVAAGQVAGTSVPAQYAAAAAIVPRTGSVVVARGDADCDGDAGRAAVGSGGLDHQHMRAIGERPGVQLAGIAVIHVRRNMLRPFQGAVDKERDLGYGGGGREGETLQTTEPESVLPAAMLEETVKPAVGAGAGVGAGGAVTVTALAAESLPAELEAFGKSWHSRYRHTPERGLWHLERHPSHHCHPHRNSA